MSVFIVKGNEGKAVFVCVGFGGCAGVAVDGEGREFFIFAVLIITERIITNICYTTWDCYAC